MLQIYPRTDVGFSQAYPDKGNRHTDFLHECSLGAGWCKIIGRHSYRGIMKILLVVVTLFTVSTADNIFKHCDYVQHLDCSTFPEEELCGNNGKTYREECSLAVDHCQDKTIHRQHRGPCGHHHTAGPSTTQSPLFTTTPRPTQTLVESVFCRALKHIDCSSHPRQVVCASNHVKYDSMCFYEKTRCEDPSLHIREC